MSQSRSSSSSVRNKSQLQNEYRGVNCYCNLPAPCQEAWKQSTLDPGRRFLGCSNYRSPGRKCNFFLWVDESYTERARDVIKELKFKLQKKDDELQHYKVWDEEVNALRNRNEEITSMLRKVEGEASKLQRLLFVVIVVFMVVFLLK